MYAAKPTFLVSSLVDICHSLGLPVTILDYNHMIYYKITKDKCKQSMLYVNELLFMSYLFRWLKPIQSVYVG